MKNNGNDTKKNPSYMQQTKSSKARAQEISTEKEKLKESLVSNTEGKVKKNAWVSSSKIKKIVNVLNKSVVDEQSNKTNLPLETLSNGGGEPRNFGKSVISTSTNNPTNNQDSFFSSFLSNNSNSSTPKDIEKLEQYQLKLTQQQKQVKQNIERIQKNLDDLNHKISLNEKDFGEDANLLYSRTKDNEKFTPEQIKILLKDNKQFKKFSEFIISKSQDSLESFAQEKISIEEKNIQELVEQIKEIDTNFNTNKYSIYALETNSQNLNILLTKLNQEENEFYTKLREEEEQLEKNELAIFEEKLKHIIEDVDYVHQNIAQEVEDSQKSFEGLDSKILAEKNSATALNIKQEEEIDKAENDLNELKENKTAISKTLEGLKKIYNEGKVEKDHYKTTPIEDLGLNDHTDEKRKDEREKNIEELILQENKLSKIQTKEEFKDHIKDSPEMVELFKQKEQFEATKKEITQKISEFEGTKKTTNASIDSINSELKPLTEQKTNLTNKKNELYEQIKSSQENIAASGKECNEQLKLITKSLAG
ncbi:MAG: hypothetical protein K9G11_03630, partial [Rickettsiaceae bacterium]|nr:hypothetical protein [Rickettsiaceae bacterium]